MTEKCELGKAYEGGDESTAGKYSEVLGESNVIGTRLEYLDRWTVTRK